MHLALNLVSGYGGREVGAGRGLPSLPVTDVDNNPLGWEKRSLSHQKLQVRMPGIEGKLERVREGEGFLCPGAAV